MIKIVNDDLLKATEDYILHQCNCITRNAAGLAFSLFNKFPYANVYKTRADFSVPGTIQVCGNGLGERYIINMFSQYAPGKCWNNSETDTYELRKQYFKSCLSEVAKIQNLKSVALPVGIGCGLAGGKWEDYYQMISDFADNNPHVEVVLYKKD